MAKTLDSRPSHEIARENVNALAHSLGLDMRAEFVPFSQSRNAKPRAGQDKPWRSLNWRVTLTRGGRDVLSTDYSQGEAHCPAYKAKADNFDKWQRAKAIALEIETGKIARAFMGGTPSATAKPIPSPEIADVLHSLAMDSDVIDYATYEDWAACLGYDPDSRSGEATYRACLTIALALRAAIGEAALSQLREAAAEM
jgi:hypothetical protein